MKVTKIQVAQLNLQMAVRLFFSGAHPVPIETLNAAANDVLRGIAKKLGVRSDLHEPPMMGKEQRKAWVDLLHKAQNFFKHGQRDPNAELDYNPEVLHLLMSETCYLFLQLANALRLDRSVQVEALTFTVWFARKYPNLLHDPKAFRKLPGGLMAELADPDDFTIWRRALDSEKKI